MKRILFIAAVLTTALGASALGKVYTLDECIQMALERDVTITQYRNQVSLAGADVREQMGQFLPSASVYYNASETNQGPGTPDYQMYQENIYGVRSDSLLQWIRTDSFLVNMASPEGKGKSYSAGIRLNYTLFNGLQNVWQYLGSRASKRQAKYNLTSGESDVTFAVKTGYYLVLKAKQDLEVAEDAVKRSEELLKLFQEKYDLGSASLSEVLKQKVQFGNDKLTQARKENALQSAFDNLALAIGLNPAEEFDIEKRELHRESIEDIGKLIAEAKQWHPIIMSSEASEDASVYDVRSAWGLYMPTLSLGYSYGWQKGTFSDIVKAGPYDHSGTWSLSLNFTIFDGFSRERNMSRAKVTLNNSRAQLYYARNQVMRDLENAYLGIKLADETMAVTEETERAAKEDFDLVQAKYNLGAAALWELLDAQVSLKEAQFGKVEAEFDYNLALALLQNALGK